MKVELRLIWDEKSDHYVNFAELPCHDCESKSIGPYGKVVVVRNEGHNVTIVQTICGNCDKDREDFLKAFGAKDDKELESNILAFDSESGLEVTLVD